jgi:hypothetical protein
MMRPEIRIAPVAMMILILMLLPPLHSPGQIAHAQAGSEHLDETGKIAGIFLRPGVRDEFKSSVDVAWSHTLDTLRGTQGGEAQRDQIISRYQDYAILASSSEGSSVGDLQFDFWIVEPITDIRIYMPSNFTFAFTSTGQGEATTSDKIYSVWTDITNDYSYISVGTVDNEDPIAPGWELIEIGRIITSTQPLPSFQILPGLYHVRLFQIRAPPTAGLYHFKIYIDGKTIGAGNFPIIIVKSSLDPACVSGLVELQNLQPPILASGRITATGVTEGGAYADAVAYFGPQDLEKTESRNSYYRYWLFGLPAGTFELTASASGFLSASSRIAVDAGQSLTLPDFELEEGAIVHATIWSKDERGPIPWGNLWQLPYGTNDPSLPINDQGPHRDILIRLLDQYDESLGYWASDDTHAPFGPPWTAATIDGLHNYSPLILKPSTDPSNTSYTVTLTDSRGLPSIKLDGHVPADAADFVEGIGEGAYKVEVQVTGYVMKDADEWQRSFTISSASQACNIELDLKRSNWILASAIIPEGSLRPVSASTFVVVAMSSDNVEKGLAVGTFPAGADRFTLVLEGFNGIYNQYRTSTDYQDYGLEPVDYTLEAYMANVGTPAMGATGVGWYIPEDPEPELQTSLGTGSITGTFRLHPASIEIALRSIQIRDPSQPSPWTFPGAGITIIFIDEFGQTTLLNPMIYGLVQDDGTIKNDPYDVATTDIGRHGVLKVKFVGFDPGPLYALAGVYPTRLEEDKYSIIASTLGYVQRDETLSTYVKRDATNDLQVDLVQGTEIRAELEFKRANEPTSFNGFVRVEVYDQQDNLLGASVYSGADPNPNLSYLPYDSSRDWKLIPGAAEGTGTGVEPQRAWLSQAYYGIPQVTWANWPAMIRSDANRLSMPPNATVNFDVFGFNSYYGDSDSRKDNLWANGWDTTDGAAHLDSGLRGSRDTPNFEGSGNYTVRVWAFDPYGPDGTFDSKGPDGIFGTEDDYTSPDVVDGGLSDFRAYAQVSEVTGVEAPWGGTVKVHVDLEEEPTLVGVVSWRDMYANLRTLPWAQVLEVSPGSVWASSTTGSYRMWLPKGSHQMQVTTVGEEELWEQYNFEITLNGSGAQMSRDVTLTPASTSTPEFISPAWMAVMPLTALLTLFANHRVKRKRMHQ